MNETWTLLWGQDDGLCLYSTDIAKLDDVFLGRRSACNERNRQVRLSCPRVPIGEYEFRFVLITGTGWHFEFNLDMLRTHDLLTLLRKGDPSVERLFRMAGHIAA